MKPQLKGDPMSAAGELRRLRTIGAPGVLVAVLAAGSLALQAGSIAATEPAQRPLVPAPGGVVTIPGGARVTPAPGAVLPPIATVRGDRFVIVAPADIDPKMVIKAPADLDARMVFDPETGRRELAPLPRPMQPAPARSSPSTRPGPGSR